MLFVLHFSLLLILSHLVYTRMHIDTHTPNEERKKENNECKISYYSLYIKDLGKLKEYCY